VGRDPFPLARRRAGARAVFVLTEPGRVAAWRLEVGDPSGLTELRGSRDNNKFVLLRLTYE
jgi:hypothetical protein